MTKKEDMAADKSGVFIPKHLIKCYNDEKQL